MTKKLALIKVPGGCSDEDFAFYEGPVVVVFVKILSFIRLAGGSFDEDFVFIEVWGGSFDEGVVFYEGSGRYF